MPAAGAGGYQPVPGRLHNLATEMLPLSVQAAMAAIDKYCPDARNLLLIPKPQRHPTYCKTWRA
jgi:glutamate--cysteine ligase